MDAFAIFAMVASAVALIFVSWALFRMTKMPPGTLFILLGAFLALLGSTPPGLFADVIGFSAPILFGAILFGCGLRLNVLGLARYSGSVKLSFLTLLLTLGVIGWIANAYLGFGLSGSFLLALICASVCSFFVFHIVSTFNIDPDLADSLMLESSLTEAAVLLLALVVFQVHSGASAPQAFCLGLVFGLLSGIVWVRLMRFTADFPHRDVLTLSLVLAVAAFCEMVFQGSGMTSALFFGLAMGNSNLLKSKPRFEGLLKLQEDVVMAGGTFFFFYAGLSIAGIDGSMLLLGGALWLAALVLRLIAVRFAFSEVGFSIPVTGLVPKGLSAVLIAQYALSTGTLVFAPRLFIIMLPIVVLSGFLAWACPSMIGDKRPQKIEEIPRAKGLVSPDRNEEIKHAYDIEEMKRTINGDVGAGQENQEKDGV